MEDSDFICESNIEVTDLRYERQIYVLGTESQKKLNNSKILIVGMGGLGAVALMYLANTGIKSIEIVDFDAVEESNLQRQIIHKNPGDSKVESAFNFIKSMNKQVEIIKNEVKISRENIKNVLKTDYNLILDCSDSIIVRYLLNDFCVEYGIDFICASVLRWEGQLFAIPKQKACFRCLFPVPKETAGSCDKNGVIGPMCGVIGSMQATEAMKMLVSKYENTKIMIYNGKTNQFDCFEKKEVIKRCNLCIKKYKKDFIMNNEIDANNILIMKDCCNFNYKMNIPTTTWNEVIKDKNKVVFDNFNYKMNIPTTTWNEVIKDKNKVVFDIRTKNHFDIFRYKDSINVPDAVNIESYLDWNKNNYVVCYKGNSSMEIVENIMKKNLNVFSIEEGIEPLKLKYFSNKKKDIKNK
ncbi:hypothetical protein NUSPORA_02341 [Nucleospora cyclopteri]